uniref:Peptidase A2 domain-containing protein n=1 Tax=Periophthalmus magnuspinnatus TaxID=409849 RepID=A0A3B4B389_9GOBI
MWSLLSWISFVLRQIPLPEPAQCLCLRPSSPRPVRPCHPPTPFISTGTDFLVSDPPCFTSDAPKIQYMHGSLRGRALQWQHILEKKHNRFQLDSTFCVTLPVLALIDSGAEEDFLDQQVAEQSGVRLEPLKQPLTALALNGPG